MNINEFDLREKYLIFSGIGNSDGFKEILLNNNFNIIKEINFPDHHKYTQKDIDYIKLQATQLKLKILTTEKDFVKIESRKNIDIKFLKIEIDIKNENELINYLKLNT